MVTPTDPRLEYRIVLEQCVPGVHTHLGSTSKLYFMHFSGHFSVSAVRVASAVHAVASPQFVSKSGTSL